MAKSNKKFMILSAIGIIMVVDSHTWGAFNIFANYFPFNSFFMPMFVFISGYFNKVDKNTNLWKYTKKIHDAAASISGCIRTGAYHRMADTVPENRSHAAVYA